MIETCVWFVVCLCAIFLYWGTPSEVVGEHNVRVSHVRPKGPLRAFVPKRVFPFKPNLKMGEPILV